MSAATATWIPLRTSSAIFPAGTYYFGDISYAFENQEDFYALDKALAPTYSGFLHNGKHMIGICNLPGDGTYVDSKGREYGVDACNLGMVPLELVTAREGLDRLGKVFVFQSDFEFGFEAGKYIWVRDRVNPRRSFEVIIDEDFYEGY